MITAVTIWSPVLGQDWRATMSTRTDPQAYSGQANSLSALLSRMSVFAADDEAATEVIVNDNLQIPMEEPVPEEDREGEPEPE